MQTTKNNNPMKRLMLRSLGALLGLVVCAGALTASDALPVRMKLIKDPVFDRGEYVDYRVHYGWITAGEARSQVHPQYHTVNNRTTWKIEVVGKTTGTFDKMLRIRDTWGSYVDTAENIPLQAYRNIEEGRYRRYEETFYDYGKKKAQIVIKNENRTQEVDIARGIQDIVSGYYYLRLLDFSNMKPGQVMNVNALFEDKTYNFKIKYVGREKIKTKFGKINALALSPIMPPNQLFDGENSIKFYVSDDRNRIPLKVSAEMFVGAVELDIKGYGNLKYPLKFEN